MQKEDKVCNITPANRVGSVQEYYFSKKLKEVAEMNAAGKNLFYIDLTFTDFTRYKQALDAIRPLTKDLKILGEYAEGRQSV